MKTLKDLEPQDTDCVSRKELKQEAINWVKEIERLAKEHWDLLDKFGYVNFPISKEHPDSEYFIFMNEEYSCWHEGSDYGGAIQVLKKMFNISEENLK